MHPNEINALSTEVTESSRTVIGICANCGCIFFEGDDYEIDHEGNKICSNCASDQYFICEHCGGLYHDEQRNCANVNILNVEPLLICDQCADSICYRCGECGGLVEDDYLHRDSYGHCVCDRCYDESYYTCSQCGEIIDEDNVYQRNGSPFCGDCCPAEDDHINSYNYKPDAIFYGTGPLYMGVELEIDQGYDRSECANELYDISDDGDLFYLKSDSSLDEGIEIVTHPCALNFHMNQFPWERISSIARSYKFTSHDAGTCGLHIHVGRDAFGYSRFEQEAAIAKVILLVDRFWDEMACFSRRDIDRINRWASKPGADICPEDGMEVAIKKAKSSGSSRYRAVNLQNSHTIEFRIFRGTLKVNTILATLQFVKHLCDCAMSASLEDCLNMPWLSFIGEPEYPELRAYLGARGIAYRNAEKHSDDQSATDEEDD